METIDKLTKICLLFTLMSVCSCKNFLEISPASNLILQEAVFSSDQTAISTMSSLYGKMISSNLSLTNGGLSVYPGISSDEIYNTTTNPNYDPFLYNNVSTKNSVILSNFWSNAYRGIYQANAIIEGVQESDKLSKNVKQQLLGEAKFIRAFYFFYLSNLFGDVPLTLTTDYRINAIMPRTPNDDVYKQIISDLKVSTDLLPESYSGSFKIRVNKWAAISLLARVYLYKEDWHNAELAASTVISSGKFKLEADHSRTFLSTSTEAIWQLVRPAANTIEGTVFIPASTSTRPNFALSNALLNKFEVGDLRRSTWINSNIIGLQEYNYPYKYKVRSSSTVTEYLIVLRLSELYLIRAEAMAQQNKITQTIADLNTIRDRSRATSTIKVHNPLPKLSGIFTKEAVLLAIEKERQTELFAEWGHRWFDLKRTNRINTVLSVEKEGWKSYKALFPIPYDEMQTNVFLDQNIGYAKQ